ncbi:MAG: penicillin-binding protein 1C [Legionella sp.]
MKRTKIWLVILVSLLAGLSLFLLLMPKPDLLENINFSTAIYDNQHHLLRITRSYDDKYRLFTPLSEISTTQVETTLLQEDQYFGWHFGINPFAIVRAIWETYVIKNRRIGASTITMQVARLRYRLSSKTIQGKLLQIIRAIQLERYYSKNEILEAYLNLAPYGGNIEGVGAASLIYFDKPANQITLPEALILSIIPQNPTKRTPSNKALQMIRNKLFSRWLDLHPENDNTINLVHLPLSMRELKSLPFLAPHFTNQILKNIDTRIHRIDTGLDLALQKTLNRITKQYIHRKKSLGVSNAAILLVDHHTMQVNALVGSGDFFNKEIEGQIDGTAIKRSPGSTLKPFIYALAIDQGLIHPNTILKDVPRSFGDFNPENFDYDFMGPIKAKDALILSRNIPAIELANQLKEPNLYHFLEQAQVSQLKPESYYGLALSLGGAELTMRELVSLYAMLANKGLWQPIKFYGDNPSSPGKRLLSAEASFLVSDILQKTPRPNSSMIAKSAPSLNVAWKTGTSSGFRDAWAIGNFANYTLAVWIGNFNNKGNPAFIGKDIAAPLFFEIIATVQQTKGQFKPTINQLNMLNLRQIDVCKVSGMLPNRFCPDTEKTWFIPGKSPIKRDTIHRELAIDKKTGLRTCHIDQNTTFSIYEFWSSDLLHIFKQAGIQRKQPPVFNQDCSLITAEGLSPQISSPQSKVDYIVTTINKEQTKIPLTAITDADVTTLYWFINDHFLAKIAADQTLLWTAKAGHYVVRVVDDHGRADARDITIQLHS